MTTILILIGLIISVIFNVYFIQNKITKNKEIEEKEKSLQYRESIISDKEKSLNEKYHKKIKYVENLLNNNLRKGYYEKQLLNTKDNTNLDVIVYIIETDRYTNGKSRIKLDYIESSNHEDIHIDVVEKFVKDHFISVVDSNDITWLDSINELQKERENKLKRILKDEKISGV
jgi:hypothetical protein